MILVIDNYDSFVENISRYLRELGYKTITYRNDKLSLREVRKINPQGIIISPGPSRPENAGISLDIISDCYDIPILGICLGHQCIAMSYGGRIVSSIEPMHGRQSQILHNGDGILNGIPSPFSVGRYHSLSVNIDSTEKLKVHARTSDGEIMVLEHIQYPHYGVQFHPESLLTEYGKEILVNFLHSDIKKINDCLD